MYTYSYIQNLKIDIPIRILCEKKIYFSNNYTLFQYVRTPTIQFYGRILSSTDNAIVIAW